MAATKIYVQEKTTINNKPVKAGDLVADLHGLTVDEFVALAYAGKVGDEKPKEETEKAKAEVEETAKPAKK